MLRYEEQEAKDRGHEETRVFPGSLINLMVNDGKEEQELNGGNDEKLPIGDGVVALTSVRKKEGDQNRPIDVFQKAPTFGEEVSRAETAPESAPFDSHDDVQSRCILSLASSLKEVDVPLKSIPGGGGGDDCTRRILALTSVLSGPVRSALSAEQRSAIESSLYDLRATLGAGNSRDGGMEKGRAERNDSETKFKGAAEERPSSGDPKVGLVVAGDKGTKDQLSVGGTPSGAKIRERNLSPRCDGESGENGIPGEKPKEEHKRKKGTKKPWSERFRELREFKRLHGHTRVCRSYKVSPQLVTWVKRQRQEYQWRKRGKSNIMTDDKIQKFEEIEFCWEPRNQPKESNPQNRWMSRLEELRHYKYMKGHTNIKQSEGTLGRWVNSQRQDYKKKHDGRPSLMTDIRERLLEDLGFAWTAPKLSPSEQKWNQRFLEVKGYKEQNGTLDIPPDFKNQQLVYWVDKQRLELLNKRIVVQREKNKPIYMTEARKTALRSLGFNMKKEPSLPMAEHLWMDRLEELEVFREENGHANVPTKFPPNPALVCTCNISFNTY